MGFYRASFGGGSGQYTQADIDSYYIEADGIKYLPGATPFAGNATFNAPVVVGDNVATIASLLSSCKNFNHTVKIGANVVSVATMFSSCTNFNRPITIPDSVKNCARMFLNCMSFNQPVNISDSADICVSMFENCTSFNQSVNLPQNIVSGGGIFKECRNLAQNIAVPDTIVNMYEMFSNCISYNGNIHISNNATQLLRAYANCVNIPPQSVVIPESVENCMEAFMGVKITNLYFKGNTYRPIAINRMLGRSDAYGANVDTSVRHNIYFNVALNNLFNVNGYYSFISGANWTTMENGFYNTAYNTYCYYNYAG